MKWDNLFSTKRLTDFYSNTPTEQYEDRSHFQRDFDRVVFSSSFRRLYGKTQAIPLPVSDFVRTRLTHSLESSCVGRSLGRLVGTRIIGEQWNKDLFGKLNVTSDDFASIVAAACLAHDIGNPPLGHSGEAAISEYFRSTKACQLMKGLSNEEKTDLQNFEGNALGFRLLSHTLPSQSASKGGVGLTYATLAAFTKYPKESLPKLDSSEKASEKKFGFFQTEKEIFKIIARETSLEKKRFETPYDKNDGWCRHPLSFLVEAADDICYNIIDFEDGHKLRLINFGDIERLLLELAGSDVSKESYSRIKDKDEKIGYLRARAINNLIKQAADVFVAKESDILSGQFDSPLITNVPAKNTLDSIKDISKSQIYRSRSVLETESAGFEVLPGLLDTFLNAVLVNKDLKSSKTITELIPNQYLDNNRDPFPNQFETILCITQFVASMTDTFAIDTYRILKGIALPNY